MVTIQINGNHYNFSSNLVLAQEAMTQIYQLNAQAMQSKIISKKLEGLLFANPYRNKEESKLAHLREESRKWFAIRRQALLPLMTET
ncbi:MAG: hypothetical protein HQL99_14695 [Magnetococcales bacterium]|nr:hypothetical protein [Magnetococcales bacterium]